MDYYEYLNREYERNQDAAQEWYDMGESDAYNYKDSQHPKNLAYQQGYEAGIRNRMNITCHMVKIENTYQLKEVDMSDTNQRKYLQPKLISSADSELLEQIQFLTCKLTPLAKQKLAIQLLHEVELLLQE